MTQETNALRSGYELQEYRIESVLGTGGFGITYKAWDNHLNTLVAIKEYFPVEWSYRSHDGISVHSNAQGKSLITEVQTSGYEWGLDRFLEEARVLARVQHPYVVRVKRYFRANGTAYIVMDYEDGEPLSALLKREQTLAEPDLRGLLEEVLPALEAVHKEGYLHRDLKPSNLYIRARDGCVMLIDFGAARQSLGQRSKSITGLVTPGYSPPEQYVTRNDRYGPWTDIYALGAVLYRCITGKPPTEAPDRQMWDTLLPAMEVGAGRYHSGLLAVVDRALAMRPEDRFQNVAEMQAALATFAKPEGKRLSGTHAISPPHAVVEPARSAESFSDATSRRSQRVNMTELPTQQSDKPGVALPPSGSVKAQSNNAEPLKKLGSGSLLASFKPKLNQLRGTGSIPRERVKSGNLSAASEPAVRNVQRSLPPRDSSKEVRPFCKVRLGKRRDRLLLLALMALLSILGGLVFNIYEEYRQRVAAFEQAQLAREAEANRLAKEQQVRHEQDKNRRLKAARLLEQVHQAITAEDWSRAEDYLKQAEALQASSTKIAAMRAQLRNAKSQEPSLETLVEPEINMKMVRLDGECFDMGSPETRPERYSNEMQHRVCLNSYWISQHEVTNAQYRRFAPDHNSGSFRGATLNDDQQPVVEVSWEEAMAYAEWLSQFTGKPYRLPTEAEWEYAARARTETVRFWGNESKAACAYANVADEAAQRYWGAQVIHDCDDGHPVAAPVGVFLPNAFALYDMLGNVSEWTCSAYQDDYDAYGTKDKRCANQVSRRERRAVRGGSWDDPPRLVRSTDRNGREPAIRDNDLGFRLVLENGSR